MAHFIALCIAAQLTVGVECGTCGNSAEFYTVEDGVCVCTDCQVTAELAPEWVVMAYDAP